MAESDNYFDDAFEDDDRPNLLPPDDRIWRHPSEVSHHESPVAEQAKSARDRWMSSTPTRAGAWSAGLVGAMLATGVVFVGMHLTNWLSRAPDAATTQSVEVTTTSAVADFAAIDPAVATRIRTHIGNGMAVVHVTRGAHTVTGDGVVVAPNGMILVPLALIRGASEIHVDGWGQDFSARVQGSDEETGLAIISVGIDNLAPLKFAPPTALESGEWLATEWLTPSGCVFYVGGVDSFRAVAAEPEGYAFLDALDLDFASAAGALNGTGVVNSAGELLDLPAGTVLVNANGQLMGIITGYSGREVVEVPAAIAAATAHEILTFGKVERGLLGVRGVSTASIPNPATQPSGRKPPVIETHPGRAAPKLPAGLEVQSVATRSPAAAAGITPGDVIEAVNGKPVQSMSSLQADLYLLAPNSKVALTYVRGAAVHVVDAKMQPAA